MRAGLSNAETKQQEYAAAQNGKKGAFDAQRDATAAAVTFLEKGRDALVPFLGRRWSVSWREAGFNSLRIPKSVPDIIDSLRGLEAYLRTNDQHQNAALDVIPDAAQSLRETLARAATVVSNCTRDQRVKRDARNAAEKALQKKLTSLRNELEAVLEPTDSRWLDFFAEIPADLQRPESVAVVQTDATLARHVRASWEPPTRADRYLVRIQVVGQDAEPRHVATVREPSCDLNTFNAGDRVRVEVTAANRAGEAAPSPVVEMVVT